MNVADIIQAVKRQFGDESGVQMTDEDIIRWINSGMRQIVLQNESLMEKTVTTSTVAGQQQYDLPVDLLKLSGIQYREATNQAYRRIKGYSLAEFNEIIDGWDESSSNQTTGSPVCYTIYEQKIIVYPIPSEIIIAAFKVYYNRSTVNVVTSTDTPELPLLYHDVLVKYCLQQAYEMDEDWDAVGNKAQETDRDINFLRGRDDWKTQESYPVITVMNEDAW